MKKLFVSLVVALTFFSCSSDDSTVVSGNGTVDIDTLDAYNIEPLHKKVKSFEHLTEAKGIIGFFDVPEMLTILKADSAPLRLVPKALANSYTLLEKDIKELKLEVNGAAGAIYYNNDTANFIFECVIPIKELPKKEPKYSKMVVLEQDKMLIYNYYGPYQNLYTAYAEIKAYLDKVKIKQSGPMREFYITDPTTVKDSMQWLTRIMVPVK